MTILALYWTLPVAALLYAWGKMYQLAYLAQHESYQVKHYMGRHLTRMVQPAEMAVWATAIVVALLGLVTDGWIFVAGAVLVTALGTVRFVEWHRSQGDLKKPLVWTPRVRRLVTAYALVTIVEVLLLYLLVPGLSLLVAGVSVLNMGLALAVTKPFEMLIQSGFKRKANTRLRELERLNHLRIVGVTGSYGKTSTKFILGAILGAKYDVLVTPSSFNTPMGICKVVNEQLAAHHDVFVCEMGARHRGDIKELVKLVEPTHSIITAVGPAHLETMGSIENIAHTKFDLARGTAEDGVVVVNGDNAHCVSEAQTLGRDVIFYGVDFAPHLSAYAKDIHIEEMETAFSLVLPGDGELPCRTKLLGRHNVLNIVGAALMARRLGLTPEEIGRGIARIEPVEHRLQLLNQGNGILVIDDAFNSNPEGAHMALEVLAQFDGYRKWIVTPGMVELGAASDDIHREFGKTMAGVCDEVVLIGKLNAPAMLEGLRAAGFAETRIHVQNSLSEWLKQSPQHWRPGDVILFENDFPDHLEQ